MVVVGVAVVVVVVVVVVVDRARKKKFWPRKGELARRRGVRSEEVIVQPRFVVGAVSLLAWKESRPMYQHRTELEISGFAKKGERARCRTVTRDEVIV